jgi:hypothetical protein
VHSIAVDQYAAASDFFVGVVADVPPAEYERSWSDDWRIIELIAHGNRAHTLLVEYLDEPMHSMPPGYLEPSAVAERGRQAVAMLGDDPVASVGACAQRTRERIAAADEDEVVGTPFGTMPLGDYLPSRAAELVLHGVDLARAVNLDRVPPDDALRGCLTFVVDRAITRGDGLLVAEALAGRTTLPSGFSVY